jgi:hypothetical protein
MNHQKLFLSVAFFMLVSLSVFSQNSDLAYFKSSYIESRDAFREKASEFQMKYPDSKIYQIPVPSNIDNDLTVDIYYVPCLKDKDKILILSSGVHGVEGFVGSALQSMFFDKFLNEDLLNETGILFVHSLNPYGFDNQRRVSENNVDLNRNSTNDVSLYSTVNEGYPKVYDFINPKGKVNTRSCGNKMFTIRAIFKILKASMPVLRQAVLQGQYQYPEGLYFGGKTFEPQIKTLTPLIDSITEPYQTVFTVDLHTGYGERGKLHLFPNPVDEKTKKNMETVFAGYQIDWGDSGDFYTVTGDFVDFTGKLNKDKTFIPMTFEYGTMDSQTTKGSLKSIHIMILENQGDHYGYKKERDSVKVKEDLLEMYYPSDTEWRTKVMKDTEAMFKTILPRFLSTDFN